MAFAWTVMALGDPWPSRSPHRVVPEAFTGIRDRALVCFIVLDEPDSRRPRRRRHRSNRAIRIAPRAGPLGPPAGTAPRSPATPPIWPIVRCLIRVSKDRPSTVSGAEESTSREHVAVIASETGRQPASCAAFVVSHHHGGLLLPDPARVLHQASSHGVRDVSSPRQRIPTTHSCPSKLCSLHAAGQRRIAPGQPGHVTLPGHPGRYTVDLAPTSLGHAPHRS